MASLKKFLLCVGGSIRENGMKAIMNLIPFGESLYEIAAGTWRKLKESEENPQAALQAAAGASREEIKAAAAEVAREIAGDQSPELLLNLESYLTQVPAAVRQSLRRPTDLSGRTVPPDLVLAGPADLLPFLPSRLPRFKPGDRPPNCGNWVLVELLGTGGFGEVWKAEHPTLKNLPPVALKFCLDPAAARTLRNEAQLLDRIMRHGAHPGIVTLRQAYLESDPVCLEYEYVEGGDLTSLISQWKHQPDGPRPDVVAATIRQLAGTVAHMHSLRPPIVHRDLKPANILIAGAAPEGSPPAILKVADFGIGGLAAQRALSLQTQSTLSQGELLATTQRGAYTPLYASPQQKRGEPPDPRDDVYALGVMWYQMLTGEAGEALPADWQEELRARKVDEATVQLLGSCLASRAERRLADAGELARRLADLASGVPLPPPLTPTPAWMPALDSPPAPASAVDTGELQGYRNRLVQAVTRLTRTRAQGVRSYLPALFVPAVVFLGVALLLNLIGLALPGEASMILHVIGLFFSVPALILLGIFVIAQNARWRRLETARNSLALILEQVAGMVPSARKDLGSLKLPPTPSWLLRMIDWATAPDFEEEKIGWALCRHLEEQLPRLRMRLSSTGTGGFFVGRRLVRYLVDGQPQGAHPMRESSLQQLSLCPGEHELRVFLGEEWHPLTETFVVREGLASIHWKIGPPSTLIVRVE